MRQSLRGAAGTHLNALRLQKRRVRDDRRDGDTLAREVERGRSAVAVACGSDARNALCLESRHDLVEVLLPDILAMAPDPGADVEVARCVECVLRDGVTAEVVRDDRAVAVACEVVSKQLDLMSAHWESRGRVDPPCCC